MSSSVRTVGIVMALAVGIGASVTIRARALPSQPATTAVPDQLTSDLVRTGLYVIRGGGANTLLRLSANGIILVDGKGADAFPALMTQVRRISGIDELPIRFLILTDHHPEKSGTNAGLVEKDVRIIGQANAVRNLARVKGTVPPQISFDREYPLHLGGIEVRVLHVGPAHTNGDAVVYFPNLKVIAVGDLLAPTPAPDYAAGGRLSNWGAALDEVLKLDFDIVVPSQGPLATRADLERMRNGVRALMTRGRTLVQKNTPKAQFLSRLKTDDLGWRLSFTGAQLDGFVQELSASR